MISNAAFSSALSFSNMNNNNNNNNSMNNEGFTGSEDFDYTGVFDDRDFLELFLPDSFAHAAGPRPTGALSLAAMQQANINNNNNNNMGFMVQDNDDNFNNCNNCNSNHNNNLKCAPGMQQQHQQQQQQQQQPLMNTFMNIVMMVDPVTDKVTLPEQVITREVGGKVEKVVIGPTVLDDFSKIDFSLLNPFVIRKEPNNNNNNSTDQQQQQQQYQQQCQQQQQQQQNQQQQQFSKFLPITPFPHSVESSAPNMVSDSGPLLPHPAMAFTSQFDSDASPLPARSSFDFFSNSFNSSLNNSCMMESIMEGITSTTTAFPASPMDSKPMATMIYPSPAQTKSISSPPPLPLTASPNNNNNATGTASASASATASSPIPAAAAAAFAAESMFPSLASMTVASLTASLPSAQQQQGSPTATAGGGGAEETAKNAVPPLRALSAYNFYFRDERDRILHGGELEFSSDKQQQLLSAHWNQDRTKKRRHRKVHGKIDFMTLSKVISTRWKELPEDSKEFYRQVAAQDWERYQRELADYKQSPLDATTTSFNTVVG